MSTKSCVGTNDSTLMLSSQCLVLVEESQMYLPWKNCIIMLNKEQVRA